MTDEKKRKMDDDEDYIDYPKFKNSIKKLIDKYPDGVDNEVIAKVLNLTVEEIEEDYASAIKKLQDSLGV